MDDKETREAIAIMRAFLAGAQIEARVRPPDGRDSPSFPWIKAVRPSWDWSRYQYRTKQAQAGGILVPEHIADAIMKIRDIGCGLPAWLSPILIGTFHP